MGSSVSTPTPTKCSKQSFLQMINILSDAHDVSLYYAELLLEDSLPVALQFYKNYNSVTEAAFSTVRRIKKPDIDMSYHDFYNQLAYLNYLYEQPSNNGVIRRKILLQVFDKSYKIQKNLIQDLYDLCM
jgi:hypothetical protein